MNLVHLLLRSARWLPERPALASGRRVVRSYGEMASRVARLACGFTEKLSLKKQDRVALAMRNCPEYYEILFACWHAGLTAVPMNAKLHPKEFAYILEDSGAKACFATPELESAVPGSIPIKDIESLLAEQGAPVETKPEDVAWLFYTSGTTGVPKGAMLTHRNMLFQAQAYFADIDKLGPQDAALHAAPLSHGSGLYGLPHFAAGAVNVMPESGHFEPAEIFDLARALAEPLVLRRADHDRAAAREPGGAHAGKAEDDHLRRRADVRRRLAEGDRALRTAPVPALRPGRSADDHHRFAAIRTPAKEQARVVRPRAHRGRGQDLRRERCGTARRRNRRDRDALGLRDGRLLEEPRGDGEGAARRLAAYRRPGQHGRRGLPHHQGPLEGHDHLGRRQHLSARDRGGAPAPSGGRRMLGRRPPAPGMGRGSRCFHSPKNWR